MIEELALTPRRRRAPVFLWANVLVLGWLAVAVVLMAAGEKWGLPRWLPLHAFLLGSVTTAIVIWSEHFAAVLCRVPGPSDRRLALGLTALTVLVTTVLVGVVADLVVLTALGGTGLAVIAVVHTWHLLRRRRAAVAPRFAYLIGSYAAASAALVVGAVSGAGLALGGDWHARTWAVHVHVTLLGWVGLSVLGTLFTLLPTALGTRMSENTTRPARRSLPVLVAGLVVAVTGMLLGSAPIAAAGLVGYAAGVGMALVPLVDALRRRRPRGPAAWMLSAATAWLAVAVAVDAVRLLAVGPVAALDVVLPVLVVGFAAQVLIGALTQLLPVVLGRGPAEHKEIAAVLGRLWRLRVVAANAAVPLVVLLPVAGWTVAALAFGGLAVLALAAAAPVVLRGRVRPVDGPQLGGLVVGVAVVVLAAGFATSGHGEPVATGEARTVDVELAGMRVRPAVVEVPPGTRLVLRVTNRDQVVGPGDLPPGHRWRDRTDPAVRPPAGRPGQADVDPIRLGSRFDRRDRQCREHRLILVGAARIVRGQLSHRASPVHRVGRGGGVRPAAPDDAGPARLRRSDRLVARVGGQHARPRGQRGDLTGPSPVDRGKTGSKIHAMGERGGLPLTVVVSAANRNDHQELETVADAVTPVGGPVERFRRRPRKLHADKG
jgi:nitrite reductase (NO-forming)